MEIPQIQKALKSVITIITIIRMNFARLVLLNTLKKEMRYETSLAKNLAYISEFVRKHDFVHKISESSSKINLYKAIDPYKMQIEFTYRLPKKKITEEDLKTQQEIFELGGEPSDPVKDEVSCFYISIQKNSQQNLHIECYTYNSQIWIQHIIFSEEMPDFIAPLFANIKARVNFNILNEGLQHEIVNWLKEIGITDDMGKFTEIMSLYKEQILYRKWLNDIVNMLSNE